MCGEKNNKLRGFQPVPVVKSILLITNLPFTFHPYCQLYVVPYITTPRLCYWEPNYLRTLFARHSYVHYFNTILELELWYIAPKLCWRSG